MNLTDTVGRFVPMRFEPRFKPVLAMLDNILTGNDTNAASQRMALVTFIIRVASAVIAFVSQVLLARWMGSFEYGVFVAVWVAIIALGSLTSIGFPTSVIRFVAEYREKKQFGYVHGVIRSSLAIAFLASTILACIGTAILYQWPEIVKSYYVLPAFLAAICLPMLALQGVLDGVARSFNWPRVAFLPTYIMRPLGILFVMFTAILIGFPPTAETGMWAAIIATYCSSTVQFLLLFTKLNKTIEPAKPQHKVGSWIIIAFPVFLVEGFYVLVSSIDILFVGALMRPEDTAIYFASAKILALVHFVYFAVKAAVSHRYTAFHQAGDKQAFQSFVQKTVTWTFWPSLLIGLVMCVLGKFFLMLFGPEYVEGQVLLWILVAGIVIRSSVGPAEALLVMAGKQNICAGAYAVTLGVNVILNFILIPMYGLVGAAIATTIAFGIESLTLHMAARYTLGIHAFILPRQSKTGEAA